jgi:hypothetical protein
VEIFKLIFTVNCRKEIDLTHNTNLRTILFDDHHLYTGPNDYDWKVDVLSQISSHFIERVTLVVEFRTPQDISEHNLSPLAALLAGGNSVFSERSTRLQFAIFGDDNRAEVEVAIKEKLHSLDAQGRLEFVGHLRGM